MHEENQTKHHEQQQILLYIISVPSNYYPKKIKVSGFIYDYFS